MATKKTQRVAIAIIALMMLIGTIGSLALMVLSTNEQVRLQAKYQEEMTKYEEASKARDAQVDAQAQALSVHYYDKFAPFGEYPSAYDIGSVTELTTDDLVVGEGEEITGETQFAAYYILWGPEGRILEQSINPEEQSLSAPIPMEYGLDGASLIDGWKEGMKGMRIGSVRVLSIPSEKAYGEAGKTDGNGKESIAPNTPLKFIVMAIPMPETIPQPDSAAFQKAYEALYR